MQQTILGSGTLVEKRAQVPSLVAERLVSALFAHHDLGVGDALDVLLCEVRTRLSDQHCRSSQPS